LLNQQATVAASSANAVLNSTLNVLGGTVTVGGDIIQVLAAGASNHLGTLNLNGGTLDLSGKKIGGSSSANNIDNLIFASGTLRNVAEINNGAALTKTTAGTLILAGTNTYTGATSVKAGTVVVSGSLLGSATVTVGDAANLATSAILGGSGSLGNVTVGAAAGNTGATLMPHAGSSSTSVGNTLSTGSVTFADGSAHLSLELGRTSAFVNGGGNGATGGDRSDHLSTAGAVSLNGADLQLSLLTTTGYNFDYGDVLFLIINGSGSAINGTFSSINGTPTALNEGAQFTVNSQQYKITYQANFTGNSFTGGNDVALMAIPEPNALFSLCGGMAVVLWRRRRSRQV
jgi:autotransporter-associated beta strand protein